MKKLLLSLIIICVFSVNMFGAFSGVYTINPSKSASASNYVSFNDAVNDLMYGKRTSGTANGPGVKGHTQFKVYDGTYKEHVSIGLIAGTKSGYYVSFSSSSGDSSKVILTTGNTGSAKNYTLLLNGSFHIKFLRMTISRSDSANSSDSRVVMMDSGASSNGFMNCRILGCKTNKSNSELLFGYQTKCDSNFFNNNLFRYGSYSIIWKGKDTATLSSGNNFSGNRIDSAASGSYFYNQKGFSFTSSNIRCDAAAGYSLYLDHCGTGVSIKNNNIVCNNYGIGFYYCYGFPSGMSVANNMVSTHGGAAFYSMYSTWQNVYHNSFHFNGKPYSGYAAYFVNASGATSKTTSYNNIFQNDSGGSALYCYNGISKTDYNNYYVTSGTTNLAQWGTAICKTLSDLQNANKMDAKSMSVNSGFKSSDDLHASNKSLAAGTPTFSISKDIDGDTRSITSPCIGADEFIYSPPPKQTKFKVYGKITTSTGTALKISKVYLVHFNPSDTTLKATDTTQTDTNGYYKFITVDTITHIVVYPDTGMYNTEMITWYKAAKVYQDCDTIILTNDTNINFSTIAGANNGKGKGFIGGRIYLCIGCKQGGTGKPMANLRVLLIDDKGNISGSAYTDATGYFSFGNLPVQNYKVWVDKPFIDNSISPTVILNSTEFNKDSLTFTLFRDHLELTTTTKVEQSINPNSNITIYPNPAADVLYISTTQNEYIFSISDITGKLIYTGKNVNEVNISTFIQGIYLVSINYGAKANPIMLKFVKR